MKKPVSPEMALVRLETLCARSEQCSADCMAKMQRWGLASADAGRILNDLIDRRFVDDGRFARAYVRDKYIFARWGRRKIRTGLYAKRIPRDIIDDALAGIDIRRYAAGAFHVVAAKLRQLPAEMPRFESRRRLLAFASGRGYETALILKILDSSRLWNDSED